LIFLFWHFIHPQALLPPNAKDQLPGRLQCRQLTSNQYAGPVNCIRSFGARAR
jgi:hypothetical protein